MHKDYSHKTFICQSFVLSLIFLLHSFWWLSFLDNVVLMWIFDIAYMFLRSTNANHVNLFILIKSVILFGIPKIYDNNIFSKNGNPQELEKVNH